MLIALRPSPPRRPSPSYGTGQKVSAWSQSDRFFNSVSVIGTPYTIPPWLQGCWTPQRSLPSPLRLPRSCQLLVTQQKQAILQWITQQPTLHSSWTEFTSSHRETRLLSTLTEKRGGSSSGSRCVFLGECRIGVIKFGFLSFGSSRLNSTEPKPWLRLSCSSMLSLAATLRHGR